MDDYTAYVNPYFVVQKGKFTKHYFEGLARIVSKLGEGTFVHKNTGIMAGGIDYIRQNAQMQEARDNYIRGLKVPPGPPTQHGIYASPEWTGQPYLDGKTNKPSEFNRLIVLKITLSLIKKGLSSGKLVVFLSRGIVSFVF